MKLYKEETWQHVITGVDKDTTLFGVSIFDYEWIPTNRKAVVNDPIYHQRYVFPIYTIEIQHTQYEFAAGEFSNCIWGFYIRGR